MIPRGRIGFKVYIIYRFRLKVLSKFIGRGTNIYMQIYTYIHTHTHTTTRMNLRAGTETQDNL